MNGPAVSLALDCGGCAGDRICYFYIETVDPPVSETSVPAGCVIGDILAGHFGNFTVRCMPQSNSVSTLFPVEKSPSDICNRLIQGQYAGNQKEKQGG